jgi:hypothetical protein
VRCLKRNYSTSKCNLTLDVTRERQLFRKSFSTGRLHSDFVHERGRTARTSYLLHYANFHILFKTFGAQLFFLLTAPQTSMINRQISRQMRAAMLELNVIMTTALMPLFMDRHWWNYVSHENCRNLSQAYIYTGTYCFQCNLNIPAALSRKGLEQHSTLHQSLYPVSQLQDDLCRRVHRKVSKYQATQRHIPEDCNAGLHTNV